MTGPAIQSVIQTPHGEQCITTHGSEKQIVQNLPTEFQESTGKLRVIIRWLNELE
jgi:hypothetical protein